MNSNKIITGNWGSLEQTGFEDVTTAIMVNGLTPEQFKSDMEKLLGDFRPDRPECVSKYETAFAYMAQMLAWTGFREGADIALRAAERVKELK